MIGIALGVSPSFGGQGTGGAGTPSDALLGDDGTTVLMADDGTTNLIQD